MPNSAITSSIQILTTPADNTVNADKIVDGTIGINELANACISGAKLGAQTVQQGHIGISAISGNTIVAGSIYGSRIVNNTIVGANLQNSIVSGSVIQANAIRTGHIGTIPCARVYFSAGNGQVVTTGGGGEFMGFDSESFDTDTIWIVSDPTKLICKTAGKYRISGIAYFGGGAGTYRYVQIVLNGTTTIAAIQITQNAANGYAICVPIFTTYQLAVNDYVEMKAEHDKGSDLTMGADVGGTHFGMEWISP